MIIEEVSCLIRRVLFRLEKFTLIITRATDLQRCELPSLWLYESVIERPGQFHLDVETDAGHLKISGVDLRLIRNSDLAMLIPPIDT